MATLKTASGTYKSTNTGKEYATKAEAKAADDKAKSSSSSTKTSEPTKTSNKTSSSTPAPTKHYTNVQLGNGQWAMVDDAGNFYDSVTFEPISNAQVAASKANTPAPTQQTPTSQGQATVISTGMGLAPNQQTQYEKLIAAGATQAAAMSAAKLVPPETTSGQGVAYDPAWATYGIDAGSWAQMSPTQQGTVAAALTAAKGLYSANASNVTLQSALAAAATDPTIVAKYADAAKLDSQTFTQSLQEIQRATTTGAQQLQTQFENERKQLAEASAAAGQAYSGFRNKAQQDLAQSESGIIQSTRSKLQQNLQNLTTSFEAKYGSNATQAATAQFINPGTSSDISLSGQYIPDYESVPETYTGQLAGGITGTQPIQKQQDINTLAGNYVTTGQMPGVTPAT